jgi:hypothetical protein
MHDGVVIAIVDQAAQTSGANGYDFDDGMENVHSSGFNGGSCLIANTYMHLAMVRHGMSFQIIDPWLTSWYASFAMETWLRDMVLGFTVGEAYQHGIQHVGIQYLVEQWWWDIFENVVYYGDPDLQVFMPANVWNKPEALWFGEQIGGHTPHGSPNHPHKLESTRMKELMIFGAIGAAVAVGVAATVYKVVTRPKKVKLSRKERKAAKLAMKKEARKAKRAKRKAKRKRKK